jgi:hypothetical protein
LLSELTGTVYVSGSSTDIVVGTFDINFVNPGSPNQLPTSLMGKYTVYGTDAHLDMTFSNVDALGGPSVPAGDMRTPPPDKYDTSKPTAPPFTVTVPLGSTTDINIIKQCPPDPHGGTLTVTSAGPSAYGQELHTDGTNVSYVAAGIPGSGIKDAFDYTVQDTLGYTATGSVSIEILVPNGPGNSSGSSSGNSSGSSSGDSSGNSTGSPSGNSQANPPEPANPRDAVLAASINTFTQKIDALLLQVDSIPESGPVSQIKGFESKIIKSKRTAENLFKLGEKLSRLNPSGDPAITFAVDLLVKSYQTFLLGANAKLLNLAQARRTKA